MIDDVISANRKICIAYLETLRDLRENFTDGVPVIKDIGEEADRISRVFIYDPSTAPGGVVDIDSIFKHIEGRLSTSDIFCKKMVEVPLDLDCPYWINDEHFELENHIRHVALPTPGDWEQLCTLTARIHSHPLDMSRPLWEMYVVEGVEQIEWIPEGCFAIISKLHHAATGERNGDETMGGLLNRSNDSTPLVPGYLPIPESKPDLSTILIKTSLNLFTSPIH